MVFLKEILGDELYEQVATKLEGTDIKLANVADGSFIDKATYDADIQKAKDEAAASAGTSELDGVKEENTKLKEENEKLKFNSAVEIKLATILDSRDKRDSVIIYGLINNLTVFQTDDILEKQNMATLN